MLLIFKIVHPTTYFKNRHLYDINPTFCIPADNSPCIKYKQGMYGLQKEKWDLCLSLSKKVHVITCNNLNMVRAKCAVRFKFEP